MIVAFICDNLIYLLFKFYHLTIVFKLNRTIIVIVFNSISF